MRFAQFGICENAETAYGSSNLAFQNFCTAAMGLGVLVQQVPSIAAHRLGFNRDRGIEHEAL
jgi:hypothetical protein